MEARSGLCKCAALIPPPDPQRVEVALKCYRRRSNDRLRWELRRVVEAFGYDMTKTWARVCNLVKTQRAKWFSLAMSLHMEPELHFGLSANAARASSAEEMLDCDQEYWISTSFLLLLIAFWSA